MDGPRNARSNELGAILSLVNRAFCGEYGRRLTMERSFPRMLSRQNLDNLYVMFDGGRLVSFLGVDLQDYVACGCRIPMACLGAVCTEIDCRGRGLSSVLLDAAYACLRDRGRRLVLISGSRSLYYRTGAAPGVVAMCQWKADAATLRRADDPALHLEPLGPATLGEMVALNAREPMRFDWSDDWIRTVPLATSTGDLGSGWIVRRGGKTVAAACLAPQAYGDGGWWLADWFGDRRAVVATLGRMLGATGAADVSCRMVLHDTAMVEAVCAAGIEPESKSPWPWPIKVLDFAGLLGDLGGHLRRTLGDEAGAIEATADGLRIRTGGCEFASPDEATAVQMIFSMPEVYGACLTSCPEPIRALLARALPIPVRHYGLNYI